MPLYTFYPIHADGLCETFLCIQLESDRGLGGQASAVLADHPSARTVEVYDEHRKIMTRQRPA